MYDKAIETDLRFVVNLGRMLRRVQITRSSTKYGYKGLQLSRKLPVSHLAGAFA